MTCIRFEQVVVDHEEVSGADYSGRKLDSFVAIGSRFEGCGFERMRIEDAALGAGSEVSTYIDCSFNDSTLKRVGGFARFVRCSFRNARLLAWTADYVELVDCVFTGRIASTTFWGVPPGAEQGYASGLRWLARQGRAEPPGYRDLLLHGSNNIRGNDFSGAELRDVSFRYGVDLTAQVLPAGPDYLYLPDAESALLRALAATAGWPAGDLRTKTERFLRILLDGVANGQRQLLLREKDYQIRGGIPEDVTRAMELLRGAASS